MIISISRRFIFIHIHKCGGESIEAAIAPSLTINDFLNGAGADAQNAWQTERLLDRLCGLNKHSPARDVKERLGELYGWFYVFATVRRPDLRIHSLYSFCIGLVRRSLGMHALLGTQAVQSAPWADVVDMLWSRLDLTAQAAGPALDARLLPPEGAFLLGEDIYTYNAVVGAILSPTFGDFIRNPATVRDPAFGSQWSMLTDDEGMAITSRIIRLEMLNEDWPQIAARLRLGPMAHRVNQSDYTGVPAMSKEDIEYLRNYFRDDYINLGYTL